MGIQKHINCVVDLDTERDVSLLASQNSQWWIMTLFGHFRNYIWTVETVNSWF